jgi:hypothetical protein
MTRMRRILTRVNITLTSLISECDLYTQSAILYAECDFDTHECDYDTYNRVFNTLKSDLWFQIVTKIDYFSIFYSKIHGEIFPKPVIIFKNYSINFYFYFLHFKIMNLMKSLPFQ